MPTLRRIYKQGSSLVVSIPEWMLEQIGSQKGGLLQVEVTPGECIKMFTPVKDMFTGNEEESKEDK